MMTFGVRGGRRTVAVLAAIVVIVTIVASCAPSLAPRRTAATSSAADTLVFESPRSTVVVGQPPATGLVAFNGVVTGQEPSEVLAPGDGLVFDVAAAPGDAVDVGDPVLSFLPAATRAEELELSVLELQRELAIELDDGDDLAEVEEAIAALEARWAARAVVIEAPAAGIVTGTRFGLELRVREGRSLFTINAPDSIAVTALVPRGDAEGIAIGDRGEVRRVDAVAAEALPAEIVAVEADDDLIEVRAAVPPAAAAGLELGESASIELAVATASTAGIWVPTSAVHRSGGRSFLLIEDADGNLRRLEPEFGRRIESFVAVVDPRGVLEVGTVLVEP